MAFTYSQVQAISHDLIKNKMTEGVFNSNALLKRLRSNQELEEGGNKIICPLMVKDDTGTEGGFYASRDALSLDEFDGISASEHDWKYIYESVVVYKSDIAKNGGKYGVLKLIDSKVRQAEMAMAQRMEKSALGDGTVSTGALSSEQFIGLDAIIASSGSYGGISPTDLSSWISYTDDNADVDRSLTKALLDKAYDQAAEFGIGAPTLGIMGKGVFTKLKGLLEGNQRTMRESSLGNLGHKGQEIVYNGIDHIISNNMVENNQIFYVDENHFKLHVHRDNNMRRQTIKDLETADALLERIFLYGAVVASERKFHSRINDITI